MKSGTEKNRRVARCKEERFVFDPLPPGRSPMTTERLTHEEMIEILEEIARESRNAAARIAAINGPSGDPGPPLFVQRA